MAAVEAAAAELLAEAGPESFSIRDVAERAGVNHALVHRHFGSKAELLRLVLVKQSERIAARAAALPSQDAGAALEMLAEYPAYWRMLARTVLDSPELFDTAMPSAQVFLNLISDGEPGQDDRVSAVVAGSLALGWLVFGKHLARTVGIRAQLPAELDSAVADAVRRAVSS